MKLKIKKGDTVQVIAGSDKGKKGKVLEIRTSDLKIRVEGVKVMTHFDKKDGQKKLEGFFDFSNVKLAEAAKATKEPKKKAPAKAKKASEARA